MKLTIITSDHVVIVDGRALRCDLSSVGIDLSNVRAVQWDGSAGHVEHVAKGQRPSKFTDPVFFQQVVDLHAATLAELSAPAPLPEYKLNAIKQAEEAAGAQIVAGFTSDALGSEHAYGGKQTDQLNLIGAASAGVDMPFPCADVNGVWQRRPHTHAQLQQVVADGSVYKQTILTALDATRAAIENATDYAAVDAALES